VVVAASAAAAAAASGTAGVVRVRAAFTYQGEEGAYLRTRLRIVRNARVVLDTRLRRLEQPGVRVMRVVVRDLDADREPEVVLDVYTGGAHCCTESLIYRYVPATRSYRRSVHGWGNAGYRIVDLDRDGRPELQTADDRFAYAFTSFAGSVFPLQIRRFQHGRMLDVTRRFPGPVARDADGLWRAYLRARRDRANDLRGLLAAWLADMYLLGRGEEGWRALELAYRRGELSRAEDGWPRGRAYLRALRAFLRRTGYAP